MILHLNVNSIENQFDFENSMETMEQNEQHDIALACVHQTVFDSSHLCS